MTAPLQPLSGVRILDLTRLLPGPWATMLLADLGAEVIKVEHPEGGDGSRAAQPRYHARDDTESVYFCNVNRNKRSITLDLRRAPDRDRFLALVPGANVVMESLKPGAADRLGVGYGALRAVRPDLIYCALTGFGQTGSLAALPGHDLLIAGMSGFLQTDPTRAPEHPRYLMADYAAATMAVIGILAALRDQAAHGRGAFLDVSMLDGLASQASVQLVDAFARRAGERAQTTIEGWGGNPRYDYYKARDGRWLTACLLEKRYWDAFCTLQGRPDLINPAETDADRLSSHGERSAAYRRFLEETFATRDRDDWVAALQREGIPVGPVLTLDEMYAAPFARERDRFLDLPDARFGRTLPQPGFPFGMRLSDGASGFALRHPPPRLGEGNAEFLGEDGKR